MMFVPESTVTQRLSRALFCMLPQVIDFLIKRLPDTKGCSAVAAAFDVMFSRNTAGRGLASPLAKARLVLLRVLSCFIVLNDTNFKDETRVRWSLQ